MPSRREAEVASWEGFIRGLESVDSEVSGAI